MSASLSWCFLVSATSIAASPTSTKWACQRGWKIGSIAKGKQVSKKDSVEECQDACSSDDSCQAMSINTQSRYCSVFKSTFSYDDMDADLEEDPQEVVCYKGVSGKSQKDTPELKKAGKSGKWTHYPYNDPAIHDKAMDKSDSYPDYDVTKGNLATSCPKDFRLHCVGTASDNGKENKCNCANTKSTPSQDDCFKCELNGALPEYPLFEDYGYNTLDGLPVMTRQQILQRAIGWVTNGPGYNGQIQNGTGAHGPAPEGCYKGQKDCPKWGYPSVCQGMVRMAWQTQREGVSSGNALQLESCDDVKPGDHIHVGSHQQIFRRWWDQSKKGNKDDWIVWQMGGGVNKANAAVWGNGKVSCTRRMKIKGETEEHHVQALREAGLLVGNVLKSGFEEELKRRASAGTAPLLV